jgi:hypothetical protein
MDMRSHPTWRGVVVAAALLVAPVAHAEESESFLRLTMANEAAKVRHPDAIYQPGGGTWIYVPRFGGSLSFGLTDWLALEAGAAASLDRDVTAAAVSLQGLRPGNLAAHYVGVMLPISLVMHYTRGTDWGADLVLSGGPSFDWWRIDSLGHASGGLQPLVAGSAWYLSWFGRVAASVEWRPTDWGAVTFGPYIGASTTPDFHFGFVLGAAYIFGVGSLF